MELVIATASGALSVALIDGRHLVADHHAVIGRGHAEEVVGVVRDIVGHHAVTSIAVDVGPGSFTGVRIGVAAARALGLAWTVPVAGISGLALVAAETFAARPDVGRVAVIADAGRARAYRQDFTRDGPEGAATAVALANVAIAADVVVAGTAADGAAGATYPRAAAARWLWPGARGGVDPFYLADAAAA